MSEATQFDPTELERLQQGIAERRGRLVLVPTGDDVPEPTSPRQIDPVYKELADQHLPDARAASDPKGERAARKARQEESERIDAQRRQAPPPPSN